MITRFHDLLKKRSEAFHHSQSGAIIVLVLAGFLILILSSLMMFDAGVAASDKMQLQTAADSAAYSQAVVKARTMNMLTYANTAKRMFYAYNVAYFAAWFALLSSWAIYAGKCFRIWPHIPSCLRWGVGLAQIIAQGIRFAVQDLRTMNGRSSDEVKSLDLYQNYMVNLTPWWGYAENVVRGIYNGATVTTAWPPPPGDPPEILNQVTNVVSQIDSLLGTSFLSDYIPENSSKIDKLPVKRGSGFMDHVGYCGEFLGSPEQLIAGVDHYLSSKSYPQGISKEGQTIGLFVLNLFNPLNCVISAFLLGDEVLDYRVDNGVIGTGPDSNTWMQSTSNITMAYKGGTHRESNREDLDRLLEDHNEPSPFESNGYFSLARSEFVYGDSYMTSGDGFMSSLGSVLSGLSAGPVSALIGPPNMWSPRWTARLRPLHLPGESLGTSSHGNPIGLNAVFMDSLPYLAVTGTLAGLLDSNFSFSSAVNDMAFYYLAASGFSGDRLQGLSQ